MLIPYQMLETETLQRLLEDFVTRDGTDYGDQEIPTATKVEQVRNQLKKQEAFVVFDEVTESVSVMGKEQANEAVNS